MLTVNLNSSKNVDQGWRVDVHVREEKIVLIAVKDVPLFPQIPIAVTKYNVQCKTTTSHNVFCNHCCL